MTDIIVSEWQKNSRELIRVKISEYQGKQIIDFRTWYRGDNDEMRPGNKGLAVSITHLPALALAAEKALTIARQTGLIEGETPANE